ncbi:MAG: BspA family leucine-rich repeat surface protein [Bacteroides sp.]
MQNKINPAMKMLGKLLGLSLLTLPLWGCNGRTSSQSVGESTKAAETKSETTVDVSHYPAGEIPFITKWQGKAGKALEIPIIGTYTLTWYNEATPDDRHTEQVSVKEGATESGPFAEKAYTFTPPTDGNYIVEAGPKGVERIVMYVRDGNNEEIAQTLLSVIRFGDVKWVGMEFAFTDCVNLQFDRDIDTPNLQGCNNLTRTFAGCEKFNSPIEGWDVSQVTLMSGLFFNCKQFDQPLNSWNVSKVYDMSQMFASCESFNQPLDKWKLSSLSYTDRMFAYCTKFNQPLDMWNMSDVRSMNGMFLECSSFNQPLDKWDINNVSKNEIRSMFKGCPAGKLPFVEKWRAQGYDLDASDDDEAY